ncbi:hypothetical protein DINM_005903 [Dirofilaria immitis]|nr:hypothetical protein [Dirofilaria immitis]
MKVWLTIFITIYFFNSSSNSEDTINCSNIGIWSSWSSWQNTIPNYDNSLHFQLRKRAFYAEIRLCTPIANSDIHCSNESTIYESSTLIKSTDVVGKTTTATVTNNITTAAILTARNTALAIPTDIVTPDTTVVLATTAIVPITVTAKSTTITSTASNIAAIIPIIAVTTPTTAAATSSTITAVKTTAAAIFATEQHTGIMTSAPHAVTSHNKVTIIDILTTVAATFATRNTAAAVFTTAATTITTVTASVASECCVNAIPIFPLHDCCDDAVPAPHCCDISTTAVAESIAVTSKSTCCFDPAPIHNCCIPTTAVPKPTTAATKPTATSTPDCCVDAILIPDCCMPIISTTKPITAAAKPTTAAIEPTVTSTPDCCNNIVPMLDSSANISLITVASRHTIRSMTTTRSGNKLVKLHAYNYCIVACNVDSQFRYQHVSKNLNERFIPDDNQIRAKRQIELCSACDNVLPVSGTFLINGERDGQLAVIYGANLLGCRTANLICDSGFLVNQTAIIYANGVKNIPLAMSLIGSVQVTLTCDENIRWKAPNSRINIWNITCILKDHPVPTTPIPPIIPPIPCSTCVNLIAARVQNPALNEGDGKLAIEYTLNEFGCRVAKIVCSSSDVSGLYHFAVTIISLCKLLTIAFPIIYFICYKLDY